MCVDAYCEDNIDSTFSQVEDTVDAYGFYAEDSRKPEFVTLDQLQAVAFLNECVNTLARIEQSDSKIVLEDELYRLNNILGWKNATDFTSVINFRKDLQSGLNGLIVNQIDRERFIKKTERAQNRAAKDAILGAISGVQVNVNMVSVISNVLISSARAYMDYNKRKEDLSIELDDELWKLEKEDREELVRLRQELMDVYNETYSKYNLENEMSLTYEEVANFYEILAERDNKLKVQRLIDNSDRLKYFSPYWYERGCAFIDLYEDYGNKADLQKAWDSFAIYETLYNKCILYRYDYRLGMIALYRLRYMENQPISQKIKWVDTVLYNIRDDGNALLYVALEYITTFKNVDGAYNLMRQILINKNTTAHNEVLLTATTYWDHLQDWSLKDLFVRTVISTSDLDVDAYVVFLSKVEQDKSIDTYGLKLKLQSSISLQPRKYNEDEKMWEELRLECLNGKYWFDNIGWTLTMERWLESDNYVKYSFRQLPLDFDKKFFASYIDAEKKLMRKVKYFNRHQNEIAIAGPFSIVAIDGHPYYYLSKTFTDISPYLTYLDKKKDGNKVSRYDRRENVENKYSKISKKYLVPKIEYVYSLSNSEHLTYAASQKGARYLYYITIPQGSNKNYDIKLYFEVDYIEESDPSLYFSGISFNDDFIRF